MSTEDDNEGDSVFQRQITEILLWKVEEEKTQIGHCGKIRWRSKISHIEKKTNIVCEWREENKTELAQEKDHWSHKGDWLFRRVMQLGLNDWSSIRAHQKYIPNQIHTSHSLGINLQEYTQFYLEFIFRFERNNVPDAMSKAVRNGKDFNFHKEVEKSGKYQVSFFRQAELMAWIWLNKTNFHYILFKTKNFDNKKNPFKFSIVKFFLWWFYVRTNWIEWNKIWKILINCCDCRE